MTDDKRKIEPIHPMRWRLLAVWIVVMTAAILAGAKDFSNSKADLGELKKTNCHLKTSLLESAVARHQTAVSPNVSNDIKEINTRAVKQYLRLADGIIAVGGCDTSRYDNLLVLYRK